MVNAKSNYYVNCSENLIVMIEHTLDCQQFSSKLIFFRHLIDGLRLTTRYRLKVSVLKIKLTRESSNLC